MIYAQKFGKRAVLVLFILLFAWPVWQSLTKNRGGLTAWILVPLTLILGALLFAACRALGRIPDKYGRWILWGFMGFSLIVQLCLGFKLRYIPNWDIGAVFNGGRDWAVNGNFDDFLDYHATFSNNHGALFLFKTVFSFYRAFGGADYYAAALVFTALLTQLAVYAGYDTAKRLTGGVRGGVMFLVLLGIYLPFYTMAAAFYTDQLSLPFTILTLNLYLRGRDEERFPRKMVWFALCGIGSAIGATIKFTAIIPLIAVVLDWVLNNTEWRWEKVKRPLAGLGAAVLLVLIWMGTFSAYMEAKVGKERIYEQRMPLSHWIMMGFNQNDGNYDNEDYNISREFANLDARREGIPQEIRRRVKAFGAKGLRRRFNEKMAIDYSSGTFKQHDFFWLDPQNRDPEDENGWHTIVLPGEKNYNVYDHLATALLLAYLLWGIGGAVLSLPKPGFCAPWMALVGLNAFLLIWETNNRYILNHFPLMVLTAVLGLSLLRERVAPEAPKPAKVPVPGAKKPPQSRGKSKKRRAG